jgi:L-ascorbate peroxidase
MTNDCLKNLTRICLEEAPVSLPFVTASVNRFDNSYFKALLRWNNQQVELGEVAFIPTDVALVVDIGLRRYVEAFSKDEELYFKTFRRGLQKLMDTTATTKKYY